MISYGIDFLLREYSLPATEILNIYYMMMESVFLKSLEAQLKAIISATKETYEK